jgi:hydrogenase-4 component B
VPGGSIVLGIDALSGAFLLLIFVIAGLGSIHGLAYWSRSENPKTATRVRFFYALMTVGLVLVFTARHFLFFLVAWEIMATSAFFLVATEDHVEEVRRAAWIYLIAAHIGTLFLFASFGLLRLETGTFVFPADLVVDHRISFAVLLAFLGFGLKAGLVPLHFWLPAAHANAPSHVSALMSGVLLKAGIYGILRITSFVIDPPLWWSFLLGFMAATTAVTGIALAFTQVDLKKALAYSSVENMGIVCLGIALALAGRSSGRPLWIAMGLGGAIVHVWIHGAFKSLLFFASGNVLHATHARSMEKMGGLLKRMPFTGTAFLIGAMSAAGLPLLNGFIGEWLILMGFFDAIRSKAVAGWYLAFTAPALAFAASLALASFFRIAGTVLLGVPRSSQAAEARDVPPGARIAPLILAVVCIVPGLLPGILAKPLSFIIAAWAGPVDRSVDAFLQFPNRIFPAIALFAFLLAFLFKRLTAPGLRTAVTWDCGYAAPNNTMQYTAGSTGEWMSARILPRSLRPSVIAPADLRYFPEETSFQSSAPDPVFSRVYEPFVSKWRSRFERLRWLQQGRLTVYLIYIFVTTLIGVAWAVLRGYLL